ncbi:hypothetical protein [Streptomyces sp. NPDC056304]|uniref:hypothetical protein n=1 Tax=Streptomyces sp. NPDC056304 TaxID=3345778 RepID=UPI0035DBA410
MRYLITDGSRRTLAAIDVPEALSGDVVNIGLERADRPDLLYVGFDLHADGTVSVGNWPDGETWESLVLTPGVPDACGHSSPALPAEPTYTRAQLTQAFATARGLLAHTSAETAALDALVQAALN